MSQRYARVPIRLTPRQWAKLNGAPAGSPMSFVLGGAGDQIEVLMAPSQAKKLAEGGKRVKFSAAAIKKMRGAGIIADIGKTVASTVQGVVDQFDPSSKLADRVADVVLEATDVLDRTFKGEKPVDYKKMAEQHNRAVDKAKQWVETDPETRKKAFANRQKMMSGRPASKLFTNLLGSTEEQYTANMEKIAAQPKQSAKSAKEARFKRLRGDTKANALGKQLATAATEKLVEKVPVVGDVLSVAKTVKDMRGNGRGRTGRPMRPKAMKGLGVSGDTIGEQAANFIRNELKKS